MPSSNSLCRPPTSPVIRTQSPAVGTLTPQAVNAPVFVPKFAVAAQAAATASAGAVAIPASEAKVPTPPPAPGSAETVLSNT